MYLRVAFTKSVDFFFERVRLVECDGLYSVLGQLEISNLVSTSKVFLDKKNPINEEIKKKTRT